MKDGSTSKRRSRKEDKDPAKEPSSLRRALKDDSNNSQLRRRSRPDLEEPLKDVSANSRRSRDLKDASSNTASSRRSRNENPTPSRRRRESVEEQPAPDSPGTNESADYFDWTTRTPRRLRTESNKKDAASKKESSLRRAATNPEKGVAKRRTKRSSQAKSFPSNEPRHRGSVRTVG